MVFGNYHFHQFSLRFAFLPPLALWTWFIRIKASIVIYCVTVLALILYKNNYGNLIDVNLIRFTYSVYVLNVEWK